MSDQAFHFVRMPSKPSVKAARSISTQEVQLDLASDLLHFSLKYLRKILI